MSRVYADGVAAIGAAYSRRIRAWVSSTMPWTRSKDLIDENDDKVDDAIEKAGDVVDDKTGDKYAGQVDKAQDLLQEKTGEGDTNK